MRIIPFILGLLVLGIGLKNNIPSFVPERLTSLIQSIPTFQLPSVVFIVAGILLLYFGIRRT